MNNNSDKWVVVEVGTGKRVGNVHESKESAEEAKKTKLNEASGGVTPNLKVMQILCG